MYFSDFDKKAKKLYNKGYIFDSVRKKYVCHSPEESVRQHMLQYLTQDLGYPRALICLETSIRYSALAKRVDMVIRARQSADPLMVIECKAAHCTIKQKHLDQLAIYNSVLRAPFIVLTNGVQQLCFKINSHSKHYTLLDKIPYFKDIS